MGTEAHQTRIHPPARKLPRTRSTWRLTDENFDFLWRWAEARGVSMNGALNLLVARARLGDRGRD